MRGGAFSETGNYKGGNKYHTRYWEIDGGGGLGDKGCHWKIKRRQSYGVNR